MIVLSIPYQSTSAEGSINTAGRVSIIPGRVNSAKYQKEADFRYGLVRVRDNAESIAFYRGEKREHLDLVNRLGSVVVNMRSIIVWNRNLGFFRNSYNSIALIVPILIVAPMFMSGKMPFGVVTQTIGAFAQVLGAVSIIADNCAIRTRVTAPMTRRSAR